MSFAIDFFRLICLSLHCQKLFAVRIFAIYCLFLKAISMKTYHNFSTLLLRIFIFLFNASREIAGAIIGLLLVFKIQSN